MSDLKSSLQPPHLFANLSHKMVEKGGRFPEWAQRERQRDLEWIRDNLPVLLPAAEAAHKEQGRGAIVIDTTSRPTGEGHPFGYFPQELVESYDDEDISRIVSEYNPEEELVVVLLKSENRTSTYRVKPLPKDPEAPRPPSKGEQEIFKAKSRKRHKRKRREGRG